MKPKPLQLLEAYVRGRQRYPVVNLFMAGPPPTSSEIFVGLDDGAQTCIRILVLSLNAKGNNPHKVF